MSALVWPAGAVIALDAENIDGENNTLVENGDDAYSWANTGSFAVPFTRTTVPGTPLVQKKPGFLSCVAFDGRSDILTCLGSAAALAYLHQQLTGDLALVFRLMGVRAAGTCRLLGTEGKGLSIYTLGAPLYGGFEVDLSNGVAPVVSLDTKAIAAQVGQICTLFIRFDGAKVRVTQDGWNWEEQAYAAGPGAGPADHDTGIGSTGGNSGATTNFSAADWMSARFWGPTLLDAPSLDQVFTNFRALRAAA